MDRMTMDTCAHPDLPPVTEQHLQHAYLIIRPAHISFAAAMALPSDHSLRRVIEIKAHQLRTEAWMATQKRSVIPVRRCRLGTDGHPVKWSTQVACGDFEPVLQPNLFNT
jgi:hypothetical protein